ncbi:MAG TPA: hypothetical protein VGC29_04830 [Flavisolibacter sp.]
MRACYLFLLILAGLMAGAQDSTNQTGKKIVVNSLKDDVRQSLAQDMFKYPDFVAARLVYKDYEVTEARLNYNRYFQQFYFINDKQDTMALARPELFNMFILNKDTFYYHDQSFSYLLTHYPDINLVKSEFISLVGKEKKGLYGTYSAVSSVDNEKTFTNDESQSLRWLKIDENAIYKMKEKIMLKDKYNHFYAASKKNFYNLFSKKEKELKQYFEDHKVNFNKEEDLLKLMEFLNGK